MMAEVPRQISPAVVPMPYMNPELASGGMRMVRNIALASMEQTQRESYFFAALNEANTKAMVQHKALMVERKLGEWEGQFATSLQGRTDYQNFEGDLQKGVQGFLEGIKGELSVNGDRYAEQLLNNAVDQAVNSSANRLRNLTIGKTAQVVHDERLNEFNLIYSKTLQDYINEPSEGVRAAMFAGLQEKAIALGDTAAINAVGAFKATATKQEVMRDANVDPVLTVKNLSDPKRYTDLLPGDREQLIENVTRAMYFQESAAAAHDARVEAGFQRRQKKVVAKLGSLILQGVDVSGQLSGLIDAGVLDLGGVGELQALMARKKTLDRDSDDQSVVNPLRIGIYGPKVTTTQEDLFMKLGHGLSEKTYAIFSKALEQRENKEDSILDKEAKKRIGILFHPEGEMQILKAGLSELYANALQQYGDMRAEGLGVAEAEAKIRQQYYPAILGSTFSANQRLRSAIGVPNAANATVQEMADWLVKNKDKMSQAELDARVRMLMEIEANERMKQHVKAQTGGEEQK